MSRGREGGKSTVSTNGRGISSSGYMISPGSKLYQVAKGSSFISLPPPLYFSLWFVLSLVVGEDEAPSGGGAGDGDRRPGVPERAGQGRPHAAAAGAPQLLGHLPVSHRPTLAAALSTHLANLPQLSAAGKSILRRNNPRRPIRPAAREKD